MAQEAEEQLAQERHVQAMNEHGEASHLGARLAQATFEVFNVSDPNRAALETARTWLATSPLPNLLIVGPTGAGKSYLAACLWNALMQDGRPALWIRVAALMNDIKRGFHDPEARAQADRLYRLAQHAQILFLDDLGKAHPGRDTSWIEEQLYGIVDARYCDLLPTVLTSEFRGDALQERIGRSVVSRLEHDAVVAGLAKPGIPYRRPRQDEP
ncbi:MAG: ATP-binding protein [Thermoleophilia bacterium]